MKTVGQLVQEAIDYMNSGLAQNAIVPTAEAIDQTTKDSGGGDKFVKENWDLIVFMGLPRTLPLPMSFPFGLKKILPQFNVHHGAEEIVTFLIRETLKNGKMPSEFLFAPNSEFELKDNKLLIPESLILGLLGNVILHPDNKAEEIGDKYWMNISDFKMFISELWGRRDLAERIMKFYLD
jgi:hypothetical protein